MTRVTQCRRQLGFTLLEMLVALTVLGFLMVALNQGVRTGFDLWAAQDRRIGGTAELDATARVLRQLLTGLPEIPSATTSTGGQPGPAWFAGTTDQVTFIGNLPTGLGNTQRAKITLTLNGGRLVLLWEPYRHELTSTKLVPSQTELMRGVTRLQLAYWGETAPGATADWLAGWSDPAPPALIRVRVTLAKGDPRRWPDLIAAPHLWAPNS